MHPIEREAPPASNNEETASSCFVFHRLAGYFILICLVMIAMFYGAAPAIVLDQMVNYFKVETSDLSLFGAANFYAQAIMTPFTGIFADKWEIGILVSSAGLFMSGGAMMVGVASVPGILTLGSVFIGIGSSWGSLAGMKWMLQWFPVKYSGLLQGITIAAGSCGSLLAQYPLVTFISTYGYDRAYFVMAVVGGLIAMLAILLIRGDPRAFGYPVVAGSQSISEKQSFRELVAVVKRAVKLGNFWKFAANSLISGGVVIGIGSYWMGPFIREGHGCAPPSDGAILSLVTIGGMIGVVFWPVISEVAHTRKWIVVILALCSVLIFVSFAIVRSFSGAVFKIVMIALGFVSNGAASLIMLWQRELMLNDIGMTGFGLLNAMTFLGAAIMQNGLALTFNLAKKRNPANAFAVGIWTPCAILLGLSTLLILTIKDSWQNDEPNSFQFDPKLGEMDPALLMGDEL